MYVHNSNKGRRRVVLLIYGVALCSLVLVAYFIFQRLNLAQSAASISSLQQIDNTEFKPVSIGLPVRITIPRINVDAVLEYVSLNIDGEMEEPTESGNAAWFNRHPLPGETGTSVIAGHFGFKDYKPAVFDNLHKLQKGDEIFIKDSKGVEIAFVVQDLKDYVPEQDAAEVFSSNDGKSHLSLITCKGAWNESLQSYDTRLVVFADKII